MARILIIDDEQSILNVLSVILKTEDYEVVAESKGENAKKLIQNEHFDLMLSDIRMTPVNGMELLKLVHDIKPEMPVIMLTAFSSMETATEALKLGAFDYILKPFKVDALLQTIKKALEFGSSNKQDSTPHSASEVKCFLPNIIAESLSMRETCEMIKKVAPVDTPVLILGEDGTGKASAAQTLHSCSHRKDGPFLSVNCAELPEPLLDSALFGHLINAFEGATSEKKGIIESGDKGSVLLIEIGQMPLSIQAKLLRYMQEKEVTKIGSTRAVEVSTRIIATSNASLQIPAQEGLFREDLYHRISVIPIEIKPLRARVDDIIPMAYFYLKEEMKGETVPQFDDETCAILESYSWPGNCRELKNLMKEISSMALTGKITKDLLPENIASTPIRQNRKQTEDADSFKGKSLKAFLTSKKQEYLKQVMGGSKKT